MTPPTARRPPRPPAPDLPALRAEVAALRRREHRRIFPALLCVGPDSGRWVAQELRWPPRDGLDEGLLFDVLEGLYDAVPRPEDRRVWLVRPGVPEVHDVDVQVAAVADRVAAAHGASGAAAPTGLLVLTRYGWLLPRTGESRTWKRLRIPGPR